VAAQNYLTKLIHDLRAEGYQIDSVDLAAGKLTYSDETARSRCTVHARWRGRKLLITERRCYS
jgi:hypothetical protein